MLVEMTPVQILARRAELPALVAALHRLGLMELTGPARQEPGLAPAQTGPAGAIAEKPELTGRAILLVAIPETLVILGFAVAAMILGLLRGG